MDKAFLLSRIDELKKSIEIGAGQMNQMVGRLQELEGLLHLFDKEPTQLPSAE